MLQKSKDIDYSDSEKEELEEDDVQILPHGTFSFLAVSRVKSRPFWVGLGFFTMQAVVLLFLCICLYLIREHKKTSLEYLPMYQKQFEFVNFLQ